MALEGTLQDMALSDLFQVFRMGPKSGVLVMNHAAERGVIYVHRGQLIDAFVVHKPDRRVLAVGDDAVLHTLNWDNAEFVFRHDLSPAGRPVNIKQDAEWLVMESMRRQSNPARLLPYHTINLDAQIRLSPLPSNADSSVNLDVDQWRMLSHAANNEDLRTICATTGIEPERAFRIAAELLAIGLIELAPPVPAPLAPHDQRSSRQRNQPAVAGAPVPMMDEEAPAVGRGLLTAIIRRVSEL